MPVTHVRVRDNEPSFAWDCKLSQNPLVLECARPGTVLSASFVLAVEDLQGAYINVYDMNVLVPYMQNRLFNFH